MLEIYAVHMEKETFVNWERLLPYISDERRARISLRKTYEDIMREIVCDVLVHHIVYKKYGMKNMIEWGRTLYGKPYIHNLPSFQFSLSHVDEWVVCAVDTQLVGIDIECVRPVDVQAMQYLFSSQEQKWWKEVPEDKQLETFYNIWTGKESYLKAIGTGVSKNFASFTVSLLEGRVYDDEQWNEGWFIDHIPFQKGYILSLCTRRKDFPKKVQYITMKNLVDIYINQ
ncbi:4'-phosphopantetheinyl transferase superfamily protein [Bacillus cereus group sp. BfR-BA-01380]|uniref:4'-phosphopantetheinyl transferase family protein n=1 Tax=Bacillus cereus group sp. BfR-BA-01380 TaxID=2920324 RepID=UPI001F582E41|nr:4'-phosphopantetheinyl transferase superfamily protein [Bacillus cereus group sp. BfR-BA-01380]